MMSEVYYNLFVKDTNINLHVRTTEAIAPLLETILQLLKQNTDQAQIFTETKKLLVLISIDGGQTCNEIAKAMGYPVLNAPSRTESMRL